MKLSDLQINESCIVKKLNTKGSIHRRLQDIGIIPGAKISCVLISYAGDPKAFSINGCEFAIRNVDSDLIEVEKI